METIDPIMAAFLVGLFIGFILGIFIAVKTAPKKDNPHAQDPYKGYRPRDQREKQAYEAGRRSAREYRR